MKEEKLKGKFTYDGQADTYVATVKKPYQWWWWLLLLLIFVPLFIRCERTVKVKVVDSAGNPVESVDLTLEYTSHYFLAHEEAHEEKETTDAKGNATFHGLECSVYSYLFHGSETMTITADPPAPYIGKSVEEPFHTTDNVKIVLDETGVPVKVQVVDAMNGQPLSGADVVVTRRGSGLGTFVTDMNGMAVVPDVKRSDKLSLAGRKAGYETNDTTLASVTGRELNVNPPRQIPLHKIFQCDDNIQLAGGQEPQTVIPNVDMHKTGGTFTVDFLTYGIPDRLIVYDEDGTQLYDTGLVLNIDYPVPYSGIRFKGRKLTFKVICDPQNPYGSDWVIFPHCPD